MNRLLAYALGVLAVVLALPVVAALAQSLVAPLLSLLLFLAIARLAWPGPRRGRR